MCRVPHPQSLEGAGFDFCPFSRGQPHKKDPVVILSEAKDLSSKPRHKLSLQAAIRMPQLAGNAL